MKIKDFNTAVHRAEDAILGLMDLPAPVRVPEEPRLTELREKFTDRLVAVLGVEPVVAAEGMIGAAHRACFLLRREHPDVSDSDIEFDVLRRLAEVVRAELSPAELEELYVLMRHRVSVSMAALEA